MDTPWLYLYVAHKLHQPQRSAYLSTMELTAGKAFSIKNLVVEMFCKDKDSEKEGKIHIYTPTTTYLRVSKTLLPFVCSAQRGWISHSSSYTAILSTECAVI